MFARRDKRSPSFSFKLGSKRGRDSTSSLSSFSSQPSWRLEEDTSCSPPPLVERIINRNWTAAEHRISTHPGEARYIDRDNYQWTALHWACSKSAPPNVIKKLLAVYPSSVSHKDRFGYTPLYYACYRSSDETFCSIIENTMLDEESKKSIEKALLSMGSVFEKAGTVDRVVQCWRNHHLLDSGVSAEKAKNLVSLWKKTLTMLRALDRWNRGGNYFFTAIHACARFKDCPSSIVRIAVKLYPHQLRERDEDGMLPYHLVHVPGQRRARGSIVYEILDGFPEAKNIPHPIFGHYPESVQRK